MAAVVVVIKPKKNSSQMGAMFDSSPMMWSNMCLHITGNMHDLKVTSTHLDIPSDLII